MCSQRDAGAEPGDVLSGWSWGVQDEPLTGRKVRRQQTPDQDTSQNPSTGQSAASPAAKHEDRSSDSANKDTPNDLDKSFQERGVGEGGNTGRGSRRAEGTGERYNDPPARPGPEASPHPVPPTPAQSLPQLSCTWRAWLRVGCTCSPPPCDCSPVPTAGPRGIHPGATERWDP